MEAMSYSQDFREKVLDIKKRESLTLQKTAQRFEIGTATITRWLRGLPLPRQGMTRQRKIDKSALLLDVQKYPDAYIRERAKRFNVSNKAIWQALKKLGISYKKNIKSSQGQRSGSYRVPKPD